jgi:hypothetical protein
MAIPKLPDLHAAMLDSVRAVVSADPRVEALLGAGSLVTGGFDAESDLDLVLIVRAADHAAMMAERRSFAASMGSLLSAFSGEHVGEPRLLIALYGPPLLHVDFKFVSSADEDVFVERPAVLWARDAATWDARVAAATIKPDARDAQWFEDRAWIWLHYGATKLRRGEHLEAIGTLCFFREMVLGPLLRRAAGERPRGLRRIEGLAGAVDRLRPTLGAYDRAAIADALRATVALYMALRAGDPPPQPVAHMPQAMLAFIDGA